MSQRNRSGLWASILKPNLPIIWLVLVLIGVLALILTGSIADLLVVPLLQVVYVMRVLYASIPQVLIWGAFTIVALFAAIRSLWREHAATFAFQTMPTPLGRVARWTTSIRNAQSDSHARWLLAQRVAQLALEVLAAKYQCSTDEIRKRLQRETLDLTPEVYNYLRAGLASFSPNNNEVYNYLRAGLASFSPNNNAEQTFTRWLIRVPRTTSNNPLDIDLDHVISSLEQALQQSTGETV